jgi:hypothetical protein
MKRTLTLLAALLLAPLADLQAAQLHGLFTHNMVLQRDKPLAVYGTGDEGEKVTVELNVRKAAATVANGQWKAVLPAMEAGGPFTLTVTGKQAVVLENVLLGDVWLVRPDNGSPLQTLALRELSRYLNLRTSHRPHVVDQMPTGGNAVEFRVDPSLGAEEYRITSQLIVGGSDLGVLYGVYRYAELLGVRFYLHGDVIPDVRLTELPKIARYRQRTSTSTTLAQTSVMPSRKVSAASSRD